MILDVLFDAETEIVRYLTILCALSLILHQRCQSVARRSKSSPY
jgi:hypothetical protein